MRTISAGLADGDFRATMDRDLVSKVLNGTRWPTAWQLDSLVRWFAGRAIDGRNPAIEASRFLGLYQQAVEEGDGTVRAPAPSRSALLVYFRRQTWSGVLLHDGTVLTQSLDLAEESGPLNGDRVEVRSVDGPQNGSEADVLMRGTSRTGFTVLAPRHPLQGAAAARWAPAPPIGGRVRAYLTHTSRRDNRLEGLWLAGTVLGPSGPDGDWQLDMTLTIEPNEARIGDVAAGAGVLDESGRLVGAITRRLPGTSFYWMAPVDTIERQGVSLRPR
ncbi:hypothetical protein ACFV2Q_10335 [Streptomyces sp. NPDC059650]|uniref:hypothetical protein n=1 Tax=Streptomyces sp. NPDC059650 TaxID=3346896 RepID=UPI00369003E5